MRFLLLCGSLVLAARAAELTVGVSAAWGVCEDFDASGREAFAAMVHPADPAGLERAYELLNSAGYFAPYAAASCFGNEPVALGGFGVELALKNTEYLVLNDDDANAHATTKFPEGSEALALGVASWCSSSSTSLGRLEKIVEVSGAFPKTVLEKDWANEKLDSTHFTSAYPPDSVTIAGRNAFLTKNVLSNAFALMKTVAEAAAERSVMSSFESIKDSITLSSSLKRVDVRIDSKSAIAFLNNIETEKRYKEWPVAFPASAMKTGEVRIAQIRRNLFTLLIIADPSVDDLKMPLYLVEAGAPVRVGLVFVGDSDSNRCDVRCVSKLYVAAVKAKASRSKTRELLAKLRGTSVSKAVLVFDTIVSLAKTTGDDVLSSNVGDDTLEKMRVYAENRNFKRNSFVLNGLVNPDLSSLEKDFMRLLQTEQAELKKLNLLPFENHEVENPLASLLENAEEKHAKHVLKKFLPLTLKVVDEIEATRSPQEACPLHVVWAWSSSQAFKNSPLVSAIIDKTKLWRLAASNNLKYDSAEYDAAADFLFVDGRALYFDTAEEASEFDLKSLLNSLPSSGDRTRFAAATSCAFFYESTDFSSTEQVGLTFVADPLSQVTQRVAPILLSLKDLLLLDVRLNPKTTEPLKSFFKYVPNKLSKPSFVLKEFESTLLTVNLITPEPWIVLEDNDDDEDPDNLMLNSDLNLNYDLKYTLVSGQATFSNPVASATNAAIGDDVPVGLRLSLDESDETVVMRNLGFFQLKAKRPSATHSLRAIPSELLNLKVDSRSFANDWVNVQVDDASFRLQNDLEASFQTTQTPKGDTLHVFSLASGKLYERFMRVMMLSVVKRSDSKIKFWLLETFLSKKFRETLPSFAKSAGFEYAFVSVRWPDWLRGQTEKQRLIWGYKILFLDVLFPKEVEKIAYVDADQVVKADLRELFDLDMNGDPIAMVPFCRNENARLDTQGFRFWESGFWKQHLRGRPYHISALFVVDLKQFRARGVGDQYRAYYQQLSADPNSLSNLDQDLPNFASLNIPLHSLPAEWLFCESWCVDSFLEKAKTIDLCNNPMEKEPKLKMAKRIVRKPMFQESWEELDEEVESMLAT